MLGGGAIAVAIVFASGAGWLNWLARIGVGLGGIVWVWFWGYLTLVAVNTAWRRNLIDPVRRTLQCRRRPIQVGTSLSPKEAE
jgi:hypothetical protein